MSQMEKEGFGEEFSICSSFCFGGIRGGQKTENTNSILCLYHSTIFRPRSKGVHPRHPPRTFPLGLLAPRCLGFLLILAIPALQSGGEGRRLFGGRKESFPQLRLVSAGLDQPAQPTPFLVFILEFSVSLPLRISVTSVYGGAHPLVMDALAEMSEAQMQMRLTHPPVRAQA